MTWEYDGTAPMFVGHDVMEDAQKLFKQEYDEATANQRHYFMALVGFKVDPEAMSPVLDHTTLRSPPSVGCFICEQPYQEGMDPRCPGEA